MKITEIKTSRIGGSSRMDKLPPITLITGTNMAGKTRMIRATELALTGELTDPENPTDSIKQNAELFKLASFGSNQMATSLLFDNKRVVERKYTKVEGADGRPSITSTPTFTGQTVDSIGKTKLTEHELVQWLRADPAGINIQHLPGLTEMKRRQMLIDMIASMPSDDDSEINLSDSIRNHVTGNNELPEGLNEPLANLIEELVKASGDYGSVLDRLRKLEHNAKEDKKHTAKSLKETEGAQKKLSEDHVTDTEPGDLEELETELEKINKTLPALTEDKGTTVANINTKKSFQDQLDKLPSETVPCPGVWVSVTDSETGKMEFAGCTDDSNCKHCLGTCHASTKYIQGLIDSIPERQKADITRHNDGELKTIETFKKEVDKALVDLDKQLEQIDPEKEVAESNKKFDKHLEKLDGKLTEAAEERDKAALLTDELNEIIGGAKATVKEMEHYIDVLKKDDKGVTSKCPMCSSIIKSGTVINKLEKNASNHMKIVEEKTERLATAKADWDLYNTEIGTIRDQISNVKDDKNAEANAIRTDAQTKKGIIEVEVTDWETKRDNLVKDTNHKRDLAIANVKSNYQEAHTELDNLLLTIDNASSVTDSRVSLEQEIAGLVIGDLQNLDVLIARQTKRQTELSDLISRAKDAAKVAEQMADFNVQAENYRQRLRLVKLIVTSVGTKGLQGDIFKTKAQPFSKMVNEVMELITPGKKFIIDYYDPRGNEACTFGFTYEGKHWTWETASRGERNMAAMAVAIARMRLNPNPTIRVLLVDNVDMMDTVYTQNLNKVIELCLEAIDRDWIDNVLLAGIVDTNDLTPAIKDNSNFGIIELTERKAG